MTDLIEKVDEDNYILHYPDKDPEPIRISYDSGYYLYATRIPFYYTVGESNVEISNFISRIGLEDKVVGGPNECVFPEMETKEDLSKLIEAINNEWRKKHAPKIFSCESSSALSFLKSK